MNFKKVAATVLGVRLSYRLNYLTIGLIFFVTCLLFAFYLDTAGGAGVEGVAVTFDFTISAS